MSETIPIKVIARIRTPFPTKFGIPRQSGLVPGLRATVVFEPEYRNPDALRGLESFSHLWLIWEFSEAKRDTWSPTVRPPRLGGNKRVGVFATRSPFRPNPVGLSCVKLEGIGQDPADGTVLYVSGADLMDGTPILDIKPYLPYADSVPDALSGFASGGADYRLTVSDPQNVLSVLPQDQRETLISVLAEDPRPAYQRDEERVYSFEFETFRISFRVCGGEVAVISAEPFSGR